MTEIVSKFFLGFFVLAIGVPVVLTIAFVPSLAISIIAEKRGSILMGTRYRIRKAVDGWIQIGSSFF